MIIFLKGWASKGLRCPDMQITLPSYKTPNSVSLIQMPNGTGKTTIIELIEACLTGSSFTKEKVLALKGQTNDSANGEFALHIYAAPYFGRSERNISIIIKFNFDEGVGTYYTIRDTSTGQELGWQPPSDLRALLSPRCIEVFVFKGDKVESLLDKTRDDAEQAIKAFFGISKVSELIEKINSSAIFDLQGPKTDKGVTQQQNTLKKWLAQKQAMEVEKTRLESELLQADRDYEDIKDRAEKIRVGEKDARERLAELESKIRATQLEILSMSEKTLRIYKNPLSLSPRLTSKVETLRSNLDQLKLPGTSRTFFLELIEKSQVCICDRPMNDVAKDAIRSKSDSYLGDEHISVVNGIKQAIQTFSTPTHDVAEYFLPLRELRSKLGELKQLEASRDVLVQLNISQATEQDQKVMATFEECVKRRTIIEGQIDEISQPLSDESLSVISTRNAEEIRSLDAIDKVIRSLTEKLAETTKTVDNFKRKELLQECLKKASKVALQRISEVVCERANRQLRDIFPSGTLIEIKSIGKHIQLGFRDRSQAKGSGAQNVAVAYSFASTLLSQSGMKFPLIVDHPMIAVEVGAREVLGGVLPSVCNQIVGFVIDTEKEGFFDALSSSGFALDTLTIFRNIPGNRHHKDKLSNVERSKVGEISSDAIVSFDPEFFRNFKSKDSASSGSSQNV